MQTYWLIEVRPGSGNTLYYTSPNHWVNCVDLATKFHDGLAAKIEAEKLRQTYKVHDIVINDHAWDS